MRHDSRHDSDELVGLARRVETEGAENFSYNSLTTREYSTLFGMIRRGRGVCDRRREQIAWHGPERRSA